MNIQSGSYIKNSCNKFGLRQFNQVKNNVSFSSIKEDSLGRIELTDEYIFKTKAEQAQKRQRFINMRRLGAFLGALGISTGVTSCAVMNAVKGDVPVNPTEPTSNVGEPFNESYTNPTTKIEYTIPSTPETTMPPVTEPPATEPPVVTEPPATEPPVSTEPSVTEPVIKEPNEVHVSVEEQVNKLLVQNPELEEQYDNIVSALNTFSKHLGKDGVAYIIDRVNKIAPNGEVDPIDVFKILYIESSGRIYSKNGELLKSASGAYGPFQVKQSTADTLNEYYGLKGSDKLNVKEVRDSIDACIYNLKFIKERRMKEIEAGKKLPTGTDIKSAIAWSYHDGPWAKKISYYGQDYINKFGSLSIIDSYPLVVEYILACA